MGLLSRVAYYLSSVPTLLSGVKNWPLLAGGFLHLPGRHSEVAELTNGCRFHIRTPMDLWIIKETCLDRQYERASVEIEDGWTVLDIGAGLGDLTICAAREDPHGVVYAYEPLPESFALLRENLRLNGIANVRAFPYAIGGRNGARQLLAVSREAVQYTTTAGREPGREGINVQSVTLDSVFSDLNLSLCNYMKMDCEGAEFEILFNASPATLQKIKHICLEYHDGVTTFSHDDLQQFLERNGFKVRITPSPVHSNLGLLYAARPVELDA